MQIFTKESDLTPSWSLLGPSMNLLKKYIWHVMYLSFLPLLLFTVSAAILSTIPQNAKTLTGPQAFGVLLFLISLVWYILATPGFIQLQVEAVKGNAVSVMTCFRRGLSRFFPLMGMSLASTALIVLGLVAFIVPGLIMIRGFFLARYYVFDKKMGPIESLKQSYNDSKPVTAWIWGVIGVTFVFILAAQILNRVPVYGFFLALMMTYPYIFAPALRYGEIVHKHKILTEKT